MDETEAEYYQRRERQERSAAKAATSVAAKRIHQDLALRYSVLVLWYSENQIAA